MVNSADSTVRRVMNKLKYIYPFVFMMIRQDDKSGFIHKIYQIVSMYIVQKRWFKLKKISAMSKGVINQGLHAFFKNKKAGRFLSRLAGTLI